jgi:uncharacterized protein (DUF362 family)
MRTVVAVSRAARAEYPSDAPYHPSEAYPEYPFRDAIAGGPNYAYAAVRDSFCRLGLDAENFGQAHWNPLGNLIAPGMTVVLKPNFVRSRHYDGKDPYAMITHPSVLRAVADYVWIALKGRGRIIIGDAPNFDADWEELLALTQLPVVRDFYAAVDGPNLEIYDFRDYWGKSRVPFLETRHMPSCERKLPGDPAGELLVNLGRNSALYNHPNPEKFYGAVFDRKETIKHHFGERQEYKVSRTVMNADVVISVPKLKVHKRSGVTLNVKGLVGICTNKNFLVHYILGEPSTGGDQVPDGLLTPRETKVVSFERWMYDHFLSHRSIALEMAHRVIFGIFYLKVGQRLGFRVSREKRLSEPGNWYGNDSTWRMATDLLKVVMFGARDGILSRTPQRRLFSVVDGIIGGERKGPLTPDPRPSAVILASSNYLAADIVAARLMGFDPSKLKVYQYLLNDREFNYGIDSLEDIEIRAEDPAWERCLEDPSNRFLNFEPYPSWAGHVEVGAPANGNGSTNGR